MPVIDTSTIAGFSDMTPEQKVEALTKFEIPESVDLSGYVKKDLFDKTSSELAEAKKTIKGKMTEDEAAAAERQAQYDELVSTNKAQAERIQKLELAATEAAYKAKYLGLPGFDEKLAEETAKAMAAGNMDKVFENQAKANEAHEKAMRAELLKGTPNPGGNGGKEQEEDESIAMARQMGKAKAESMKSANGNMDKFKI